MAHRRVRIALLAASALAAGAVGVVTQAPAPPAAAADTPTVPLLTGGLLRYSGSVGASYDFDSGDGVTENMTSGPTAFSTTWLIAGMYPNTSIPSPDNWPKTPDSRALPLTSTPGALAGTGTRIESSSSGPKESTCSITQSLGGAWSQFFFAPGNSLPTKAIEASGELERQCSGDDIGYYPDLGHQPDIVNAAFAASDLNTLPATIRQGDSWSVAVPEHGDPQDGNTYTFTDGSAQLTCAICVSDITFKQLADPTTGNQDKVEVPDTGTYDGNVVELTATVHNAASVPLDVPFTFVDETTQRLLNEAKGSQLLRTQHFAAGETRTLTFDWDTRGTAWRSQKRVAKHQIAVLTQFGGAQRTITILPKPVVLVHGWNSDASTWGAMKSLLKAKESKWAVFAVGDAWSQAGMTMNTNPVSGNSIEQNARAESRYIEHVRQMTRAQHVDLVVHSMGGLISRDYIDHMMLGAARPPGDQPLVAHLVMLGTPNQGSACAYAAGGAAALFGDAVPSIQLTPAYVDGVFNRYVRNQHGVKFSVDAGTGFPVCFTGDGDTVVTRDSAWWIYNDVGTLPGDIHTELPGDPTAVDHWVMPHIAKAWFEEDTAARRAAPVRKAKAAPSPGQLAALARPKVRKGHPVTVEIPVTGAKQLTVSVVAPRGVALKLRRPGGKVVASQKASSTAARRPFRALRVLKPKAGTYRLVLTNTAAKLATVMVSAALKEPAATQSATIARLSGRRMQIVAKLKSGKHPLRKAKVHAYVRRIGGGLTTIRLRDDGAHHDGKAHDGRYGGRTKALPPGDYAVAVKGVRKSVVRWTVLGLRVS